MIQARFLRHNGTLCGFSVQGHSGYAEQGADIVCAAVSSAVYLTANTITEICGCRAESEEADGKLVFTVPSADEAQAQVSLRGLWLHLQGLAAQYPQYIQIQQTEV